METSTVVSILRWQKLYYEVQTFSSASVCHLVGSASHLPFHFLVRGSFNEDLNCVQSLTQKCNSLYFLFCDS
jgi:hypothetical protein